MTTFSNSEEFLPPPDLTSFLERADDQYLGGGCYSDVYQCLYHGTDAPKQVAVKAFRFRLLEENVDSDKSNKMIRRELGIWRRLKHNNIVPFLGVAHGFGMQDSVSLVSSWMPNGTLSRFLEKHEDELGVAHRLQLLLDIANGLHYLHSLNIIHGDLYCNNVLIDADRTARLVDFGLASLVGSIPDALSYLGRSTTRPGALRWAAPEQVLPQEGSKLTVKSDIYSFGCIGLQVLSGKKPWSEVKEDGRVVVGISQGHTPARPVSRAIDDHHWMLIKRCWLSPQERPSAKEIITSIEQFLLPLKATSDRSSLGSSGDGAVDGELFGEAEAVARDNSARGILRLPKRIDPSGSTGKQLGAGETGEAEVQTQAQGHTTVEHPSDGYDPMLDSCSSLSAPPQSVQSPCPPPDSYTSEYSRISRDVNGICQVDTPATGSESCLLQPVAVHDHSYTVQPFANSSDRPHVQSRCSNDEPTSGHVLVPLKRVRSVDRRMPYPPRKQRKLGQLSQQSTTMATPDSKGLVTRKTKNDSNMQSEVGPNPGDLPKKPKEGQPADSSASFKVKSLSVKRVQDTANRNGSTSHTVQPSPVTRRDANEDHDDGSTNALPPVVPITHSFTMPPKPKIAHRELVSTPPPLPGGTSLKNKDWGEQLDRVWPSLPEGSSLFDCLPLQMQKLCVPVDYLGPPQDPNVSFFSKEIQELRSSESSASFHTCHSSLVPSPEA